MTARDAQAMHPYRVPGDGGERPERRVRSGWVVLVTLGAWIVVGSDAATGWRGLLLFAFVAALAVLAFLDRSR